MNQNNTTASTAPMRNSEPMKVPHIAMCCVPGTNSLSRCFTHDRCRRYSVAMKEAIAPKRQMVTIIVSTRLRSERTSSMNRSIAVLVRLYSGEALATFRPARMRSRTASAIRLARLLLCEAKSCCRSRDSAFSLKRLIPPVLDFPR